MLTIAFGSAIGLILLYVSTECSGLPAKHLDSDPSGGYLGSNQRRIQKCGSELTSMITWVCNGYFYNPYEDYGENAVKNETKMPDFDHNGVVERCCKNPCDREFLKQHCRRQPKLEENAQETKEKKEKNELSNFLTKKTSSTTKNGLPAQRKNDWRGRRTNDLNEVRKGKRWRKKRKNCQLGVMEKMSLFKSGCGYQSFGHFLLNLDNGALFRIKIRKRKNVQSFEYGTIKPEILGGNPVIVGSRHGWSKGNSIRSLRRTVSAQY